MSGPSAPLPPAVESAYQTLSELGPLSAPALREALKSAGFTQSILRLAQLPDRFPARFHLTATGLLSIAAAQPPTTVDETEDETEDGDWYRPTTLSRFPVERVAVLDIETTGLDPTKDFVCEIALIR